MNKKHFEGIIPALITPYNSNGRVNENALEKLININIAKGVSGFYICGSSGESMLLSIDERKYIMETVSSIVNNRVDVIANIGTFSTEQGIELAKKAEQLNLSAISSVPPFYFKFDLEEYVQYYNDITTEVNLPMIIYNLPNMSGVNFSTEMLNKLLSNDSIIGMKHTSYDLFQLEQVMNKNKEKTMFIGHDEIFLPALSLGVNAGIGSTFNFMAEKFVEMQNKFKENKLDEARLIQDEANNIITVLCKVGVFKGLKAALKLQGLDCGDCRKPFQPLSKEEVKVIENVLKENSCL